MDETDRPVVLLSDRQSLPVDAAELMALARRTLVEEGHPDVELSVSLVGEEEMADLHRRYLGEPGPTDVLAFPQDEADPGEGSRLLGDVVICPAVAARQGDLRSEVRVLLVHGILHLLGYEHAGDAERAAMWARQERYSGVAVPEAGGETEARR